MTTQMLVFHEQNRVILDLGGQRFDTLLTCAQAEQLEHALRYHAAEARKEPTNLLRGQVWFCHVESYDGKVVLRFLPPMIGAPRRVPLPPDVADQLAENLKFKRQQAEHKMRFQLA